MFETVVTILAGAASGVGAIVAKRALNQDEDQPKQPTDPTGGQATPLVERVCRKASTSEEMVDALNGFSIVTNDNTKLFIKVEDFPGIREQIEKDPTGSSSAAFVPDEHLAKEDIREHIETEEEVEAQDSEQ